MSEFDTNWTKKEFKAYLMLYASDANFFQSEEERELIQTMLSDQTYKTVHREIEKDNDYQRIQKILDNIEKHEYSKEDLNALIADVKRVFDADGQVDTLEENMLRALKHLLH
jgi:hypothetical protein